MAGGSLPAIGLARGGRNRFRGSSPEISRASRRARINVHLLGPHGKVVPVMANQTLTLSMIAGHPGNSPHRFARRRRGGKHRAAAGLGPAWTYSAGELHVIN
ncbi:MAG: hypothetical protein ACLQME_06680 [Alphaproteobacteria bacterium]